MQGEFTNSYIAKCLQAAAHEIFTVTHAVSEYHYTLYYYDQAGNLVKTVPPNGVQPKYDADWTQQVTAARENRTVLVPDHQMATRSSRQRLRHGTLLKLISSSNHNSFADIVAGFNINAKPLYNGNISSMAVNIPKLGNALVYAYTYDQLNRLTAMDAWGGLNNANNQFTPVSLNGAYQERITYDSNGNILTYKRNGNKTCATFTAVQLSRLTIADRDPKKNKSGLVNRCPQDLY